MIHFLADVPRWAWVIGLFATLGVGAWLTRARKARVVGVGWEGPQSPKGRACVFKISPSEPYDDWG
jgi:hypothetical protein